MCEGTTLLKAMTQKTRKTIDRSLVFQQQKLLISVLTDRTYSHLEQKISFH